VFPNLLQLISRRPLPDYERRFVLDAEVKAPRVRNRRIERLFVIGWALIAVKSVLVAWAVPHYHIPFSALWVIVPTVVFAALCTLVYFRR